MFRNLSKRIEVVTPVVAKEAKEKLWEVLDICLRDERQAWVLRDDGSYSQPSPAGSGGKEPLGTHAILMELTRHRSG
jgi:polyphosphate kinase